MACTTRETVTRTLGQFRKDGWISIDDSIITVQQPDRLQMLDLRRPSSKSPAIFLKIPTIYCRPRTALHGVKAISSDAGVLCAYDSICTCFSVLLFSASAFAQVSGCQRRSTPAQASVTSTSSPEMQEFQQIEDEWDDAVNLGAINMPLELVLSPLFVDVSASGDITTRNQQLASLIAGEDKTLHLYATGYHRSAAGRHGSGQRHLCAAS